MQDVQQRTPEEADTSALSPRKANLFTTFAAFGAGLIASLTRDQLMEVLTRTSILLLLYSQHLSGPGVPQ